MRYCLGGGLVEGKGLQVQGELQLLSLSPDHRSGKTYGLGYHTEAFRYQPFIVELDEEYQEQRSVWVGADLFSSVSDIMTVDDGIIVIGYQSDPNTTRLVKFNHQLEAEKMVDLVDGYLGSVTPFTFDDVGSLLVLIDDADQPFLMKVDPSSLEVVDKFELTMGKGVTEPNTESISYHDGKLILVGEALNRPLFTIFEDHGDKFLMIRSTLDPTSSACYTHAVLVDQQLYVAGHDELNCEPGHHQVVAFVRMFELSEDHDELIYGTSFTDLGDTKILTMTWANDRLIVGGTFSIDSLDRQGVWYTKYDHRLMLKDSRMIQHGAGMSPELIYLGGFECGYYDNQQNQMVFGGYSGTHETSCATTLTCKLREGK